MGSLTKRVLMSKSAKLITLRTKYEKKLVHILSIIFLKYLINFIVSSFRFLLQEHNQDFF